MSFQTAHRITRANSITLAIAGHLDITQVADVRTALQRVLRVGADEIVVDLADAEHLDVAVVTALASAVATAQSAGTTIRLELPTSADAQRTLDYCGLPALLAA